LKEDPELRGRVKGYVEGEIERSKKSEEEEDGSRTPIKVSSHVLVGGQVTDVSFNSLKKDPSHLASRLRAKRSVLESVAYRYHLVYP